MASPYCPLFDWSHWSHYSWLSNNWSMVLKADTAVAGRGAEDEGEKDMRGFPCRCLPLSWGYLFFRLSPTNERLNFLENWGAKGDDGRREHKAGGSCHGDDISIMVTMVITGVVMIAMIKMILKMTVRWWWWWWWWWRSGDVPNEGSTRQTSSHSGRRSEVQLFFLLPKSKASSRLNYIRVRKMKSVYHILNQVTPTVIKEQKLIFTSWTSFLCARVRESWLGRVGCQLRRWETSGHLGIQIYKYTNLQIYTNIHNYTNIREALSQGAAQAGSTVSATLEKISTPEEHPTYHK